MPKGTGAAAKRTKYQKLVSAKASACKGRKTNAQVKAVAKEYVDDAVKKGKTKAEADKIANRVLRGGCAMTSVITGTKKRKTTPKKRTTATKKK